MPWGDSVKLNYGEDFDDNPVLWTIMKDYTVKVGLVEGCAKIENRRG